MQNRNKTLETQNSFISGELLGTFCEDFGQNRPHYNDTTLFFEFLIVAQMFQ